MREISKQITKQCNQKRAVGIIVLDILNVFKLILQDTITKMCMNVSTFQLYIHFNEFICNKCEPCRVMRVRCKNKIEKMPTTELQQQ